MLRRAWRCRGFVEANLEFKGKAKDRLDTLKVYFHNKEFRVRVEIAMCASGPTVSVTGLLEG